MKTHLPAAVTVVKASPKDPIYIAFYTIDTPYEEEAKKLEASLREFSLPYEIEAIPTLGSWQENTKYKAIFIQNMLFKHTGRAVVYLDCDAVIRERPTLFDNIDCDIAVHYYESKNRPDRELLSGTLYVAPTENARRLIELWRYVNQEYPSRWEQKNLSIALKFMPEIKIYELPPTYCLIFDLMKDRGRPVIEHFQASRRYKDLIDGGKPAAD